VDIRLGHERQTETERTVVAPNFPSPGRVATVRDLGLLATTGESKTYQNRFRAGCRKYIKRGIAPYEVTVNYVICQCAGLGFVSVLTPKKITGYSITHSSHRGRFRALHYCVIDSLVETEDGLGIPYGFYPFS
jgi:hypothetical protein